MDRLQFPAERILYTDLNGGQILGYTKGDLHRFAVNALQSAERAPTPLPHPLSDWQALVLQTLIECSSRRAASKKLGCGEWAIKSAIERMQAKYPGKSVLQLCVMYSRSLP